MGEPVRTSPIRHRIFFPPPLLPFWLSILLSPLSLWSPQSLIFLFSNRHRFPRPHRSLTPYPLTPTPYTFPQEGFGHVLAM